MHSASTREHRKILGQHVRGACVLVTLLALVGAAPAQDLVILSWNDLGMHCMNQWHENLSILPPYNTLEAQLILRGDDLTLPQIVQDGYQIEYSIPGNTYSAGKTDFWDYDEALFGVDLPLDIGLTGLGLTGDMTPDGDIFAAVGIPITPFPDATPSTEDPYQQALLEVRDLGGAIVAQSAPVIPVSVEIGCVSAGCHSSETAMLYEHENEQGFDPTNTPILCASCHADPALGTQGNPEAGYFSEVIHKAHTFIDETIPGLNGCQKCHPGPSARCLRGTMANDFDMICQDCHGDMEAVSQSIDSGRVPWVEEPSCRTCHTPTYGEPVGQLYRVSEGHGGVRCIACHGSPHAIFPSREARDNANMIEIQGHAGVLRSCQVCHGITPSGPGPHGLVADVDLEEIYAEAGRLVVTPSVMQHSCSIELEPGASDERVIIYDADGRLVRYIRTANAAGIHQAIEWDGRDVQGNMVTAGVYYIRHATENGNHIGKVLVMR